MNKELRVCKQEKYCKKMVEYLPLLRVAACITQNELAKKLGVTRVTIVSIESGKRNLRFSLYLSMVTIFSQYTDAREIIDNFDLFDRNFLLEI